MCTWWLCACRSVYVQINFIGLVFFFFFLSFLAAGGYCLKARWRNSIVACLWTFRLRGEKGKKYYYVSESGAKVIAFLFSRQCGKQVTCLEPEVPLIFICGWERAYRLYLLDQIRHALQSATVFSLFAKKKTFVGLGSVYLLRRIYVGLAFPFCSRLPGLCLEC